MPSPDRTATPERPAPRGVEPRLITRESRAMASIITVHVPDRDSMSGEAAGSGRRAPSVERAIAVAFEEFHTLEYACTRFEPSSPLMRANRSPGRWHRAPEALYATLLAASRAHRRTGGLFDPRVHDRLIELGYDRSFHLIAADPAARGRNQPPLPRPPRRAWRPRLLPGLRLVHLGGSRIDLGGVGKSVALLRASSRLRSATRDFLIDAGGDIYASGCPGTAGGWSIAVESPCDSPGPVAVLEVSDRAVATSSTRLRRWRAGDRTVHHLIDPRTGEPGGQGLAAVTVVHEDPVAAETWAKALFLAGSEAIGHRARAEGLAALWVDTDDRAATTPAMAPYLVWSRP